MIIAMTGYDPLDGYYTDPHDAPDDETEDDRLAAIDEAYDSWVDKCLEDGFPKEERDEQNN